MDCADTNVTVRIPDRNLAAEIRKNLNLGASDPIPRARLQELKMLNMVVVAEFGTNSENFADDSGISDLTGLEEAEGLRSLTIRKGSISDLGPLAGLQRLTELELPCLENNKISSFYLLEKRLVWVHVV